MSVETHNLIPPDLAATEQHDQTTEKPRTRPAESLRVSETRYRRLFETTREGILILDAGTLQITDVNPYMVELLGYSREEFLGRELFEIGLFADEAASQRVYRELQSSGYVRYEDLPLQTKDGRRWDVEFVSNIYEEDGRQVIQCNIRDITVRKQAETARALLASMVEAGGVSIISIDFNTIITSWNKGAEALYGYSAAETIGRSVTMLTLPEDLQQVLGNIEKIRHNETVEVFETIRLNKDGRRMNLEVMVSPVRDAAGGVVGVSTIARDITARRLAEAQLENAQANLSALIENTRDAIWSVGADYRVLAFNSEIRDRLLSAFGTGIKTGGDGMQIMAPEYQLYWKSLYDRALAGEQFSEEQPYEVEGETRFYDVAFNPILSNGAISGVAVFSRDITERKHNEAALREREATLQAILSASPDVISFIGADGLVKWSSAAFATVTGGDPAALPEQSVFEVLRAITHPDDVEAATRQLQEMLAGQSEDSRLRLCIASPQGGFAPVESNARLMRDGAGEITGIISVARDVTEQSQLEENLLAAKAEAERANHAKSEFLSRMSHELRTPLNAILGFGQLLKMDELNDEQTQGVGQILQGGRHLLDLINEVLDIARIESGNMEISPEPVSVREVVRESLDLIRPLAAASNITLRDEISANCPFYVRADRQRLKQVLLNLLANAVKYNCEAGTVTLTFRESATGESATGESAANEAERRKAEEDRRRQEGGRRQGDKEPQAADSGHLLADDRRETDGGDASSAPQRDGEQSDGEQRDGELPMLRLEITDTGHGIPAAYMSRLFVPFERLGAEQTAIEGTGVGLALSKRLVELMDGRITVESTEGEGSTFSVELPLAQEQIEESDAPDSDTPSAAPAESQPVRTVLYIEDNSSNLKLIERLMGRRPHVRLLSAMHGKAGLELAREHRPDLILLDLHLPDINGDEVLRLLQAEAETRAIPVVMLSADATPRQVERLLQAGATAYLTKPLDVRRFLTMLDDTLRV